MRFDRILLSPLELDRSREFLCQRSKNSGWIWTSWCKLHCGSRWLSVLPKPWMASLSTFSRQSLCSSPAFCAFKFSIQPLRPCCCVGVKLIVQLQVSFLVLLRHPHDHIWTLWQGSLHLEMWGCLAPVWAVGWFSQDETSPWTFPWTWNKCRLCTLNFYSSLLDIWGTQKSSRLKGQARKLLVSKCFIFFIIMIGALIKRTFFRT